MRLLPNAQTNAREILASEMLNDALQSVVPARTPAGANAKPTRRERDVVRKNQYMIGRQLVKLRRFPDRNARGVHHRHRLHQKHPYPADDRLTQLWTKETGVTTWETWLRDLPGDLTLSFSGGVADCIQAPLPLETFGDLGPLLGQAIRNSRLCAGDYLLGRETIRATVIGAGSHSTQLSGSTVFHRSMTFPLKNLPVLHDPDLSRLPTLAEPTVLALPGPRDPSYEAVSRLASAIARTHQTGPVLVCLEQDMAKALGHALAARLPESTPILCIDRVKLSPESYLDIAAPIGPALPVVVKTLILSDFNRR